MLLSARQIDNSIDEPLIILTIVDTTHPKPIEIDPIVSSTNIE
jgi:hypothetical protein